MVEQVGHGKVHAKAEVVLVLGESGQVADELANRGGHLGLELTHAEGSQGQRKPSLCIFSLTHYVVLVHIRTLPCHQPVSFVTL